MSDKCTKPGNEDKRRYKTRTDAAFALQNLRSTGVIKEDEGFVYPCGHHFHFTSQPIKRNEHAKLSGCARKFVGGQVQAVGSPR